MSTATADAGGGGTRKPAPRTRRHTGRWVAVVLTVLAVIFVVAGTNVVSDEELAAETESFDKETFGAENFADIQAGITEQAIDGPELAAAIADDPEGAAEEYGNEVEGKTVFPTTVTGTVEENESGLLTVAVDDMPDDIEVRVQAGDAINGTELRDATGDLEFSQFTNQIEFQDAGSALNEEMKTQVLEPLDVDSLDGETITVTGAFTSVNPEAWLVTPVSLEVG